MIDWAAVFDEAFPEPGASEAELERFVTEVGQPLPAAYLSLLGWSNGGEFRSGERWFQFFPALEPSHGVLAIAEAYGLTRWMPGALPIAFNGAGTAQHSIFQDWVIAAKCPAA